MLNALDTVEVETPNSLANSFNVALDFILVLFQAQKYKKSVKITLQKEYILEQVLKSSKSIQKNFSLEFVILINNCTFAPLIPKFGNRNGMFN